MRTMVQQVSFSIDGAFIAEQARGMVIAGKWRVGLEMLVEDLGMSYEQAFEILRGDKTLTGDSVEGILMADVEEGHQEVGAYLGNSRYMYAGLWKYKGRIYVPYGRVDSFDEHDLAWAAEQYAPEWNEKRCLDVPFDVLLGRVLYYADDRDHHLVTIGGDFSKYMTVHAIKPEFRTESKGGYLWKPIEDIPLWIKPHDTASAALTEYLEIRPGRLSIRESPGIEALRWQMDGAVGTVPCTGVTDNLLKTVDDFEAESNDIELPEEEEPAVVVEEPIVDPQEEKRLRYEARIAREEKAEQERQAKRKIALDKLRSEIIEANGSGVDDWIRVPIYKDLEDRGEDKISEWLSVPKKPFLNWVYGRSPAYRLAPELIPEWKPFSPVGMKMYGDDPVHSDWVVGAGIDPEDFYQNDSYNNSTYRKRMDILRDTMGFEVEVFAGSGFCGGTVVVLKPGDVLTGERQIGVIANGSMEYDAALRSAVKFDSAIIMAVGGKLCHAATVARETGLRLVMWPKATELKNGDHVWLNLNERQIKAEGH